MKKFLKAGKKALSVIMAVLMVMTAWVWVAPEHASAATAGNYKVRITWQNNNKKKYSNHFGGTETEQGARAGFILYYKSNNGTGTENKVWWDIGWNNNSGKGAINGTYVSGSNSTGWTDSGTGTDYTCEATIAGFPTALFGMADSDNGLDTGTYTIKKLEVYSNADNSWKTLWAGSGYTSTSTKYKWWKITPNGTGANGVGTISWDGTKDGNGDVSTTTENWKFPTPTTTTTYTGKVDNVSVPKSGTSNVMTVKVVANDQYGVQMGTPTWSVKGSVCGTTGISVDPTSGDSTTVKLTNAANVSSNVNTQTGTITATWGSAGSLSDTFTITDSYYTATFNYQTQNADNKTSSTKTETREGYHGDSITAPTPPQYYDQDFLKTFDKWSPTYSSTITKDVTYAATYTEKFVSAIYKAVDDAIAAVDEVKTEWGDDYQSRFTYSSRKAIDDAIKAVVTGLGRTQQETVDGYAAAINAALAALETNKYAVIFLDNNGSILLYEKNAEYKSFVKAPDFPDAQKKYYDSEKHYEYTGWDSEEYKSVVDDLVIQPVYEAQAHNFTRTEEVTSTCTQKGATKYICDCGYSYIVDKGDYGDHVWGDFEVDIHPTCTTAGQKSKYCTVEGCNAQTDITVIDPLGHQWGTVSSLAPATCDRDGINTRLCDACGFCEHTIVPMTGHNYEKTTVAPTCTAKGYDEYTCDTCGHSYRDYNVDMLAHVYTEETLSAAKCDIPGVKKLTCACGHVKTEAIPALSHNALDAIEWEVVVPATCEYAGYKTKTCSKCGNVIKAETIDALTHDLETTTTPATCTTAGTTVVSCKRENCGYEKTTVTQPLTHDWNNGVEKKADCTHSAYTLYTCQRENCGETKIEVKDESAPALGHDFDENVEGKVTVVDATCEEDGSKTVVCSRCTEAKVTVLPALGHDWSDWTVVPSTNNGTGSAARSCKRTSCNETETVTIPAGGHTFNPAKPASTTAASCTSGGTATYKCTNHDNCGIEITIETAALGHDFSGEGVVTKAATCIEDGKKTITCSRCDATNEITLPKLGHKYENEGAEVVTAPTCDSKGYTKKTCDTCGDVIYVDVVQAPGHKYDKKGAVVTTDATCEHGAYTTYNCDNCEYSYVVNVQNSTLADHTWKTVEEKAADCENNGFIKSKCSVCNAEKEEVLPRLGHAYGDWEVVKAATNTEDGEWKRVCAHNEKHVETLTIPKGGHTWDMGTVKEAATCTKEGIKVYSCNNPAHTDCDITLEVTIPATQHTVAQKESKKATCTTKGEVESYCSICGESFSKYETPVVPHTYAAGQTFAPTCTTSGYTVMVCSCGASYNMYDASKPATGHSYTGSETTAPGCTTEGVKTYTCACGEGSFTDVIPAKGHNFVENTEKATAATCTALATKTFECSCGASYVKHEGALAEHNFDELVKTVPATNDSLGYEERKCDCGLTKITILEATGTHVFTEKIEGECVAPTCTENGTDVYKCTAHEACTAKSSVLVPRLGHTAKAEYTAPTCIAEGSSKAVCETCGDILATEIIPAIPYHNFSGEGEVTLGATCTDEGTMTYTCQTDGCNATKTETIPAKGHKLSVDITEADCETKGKVVISCDNCNDVTIEKTVEFPALGHSWNDGELVDGKDATCTQSAQKLYTCTACNKTKTETIPAKGHSFGAWEQVSGSVNTDGYWKRTCACGETETLTIPRGHNLVKDTVNSKLATCTAEGKEVYICNAHTNCDVKIEVTLPMLQHNYTTEYVDSTCDRSGYIKTSCTVCKKLIVEKYISPKAHTFDNGTKYPATCTEAAYHLYECINTDAQGKDNCNYSYKAFAGGTDAALGHNLVAGATSATCEGKGSQTFYCNRENCGYATTVEMPARGHDYVLDATTTATCAAPATKTYKCSRCADSYTVFDGEKSETHNAWSAWTVVEATNTSLGYKTKTCNTCGQKEFEIIPATGEHVFDIIVSETKAKCEADGEQIYSCSAHPGETGCKLTSKVTIPATGHTETFAYESATCSKDGLAKMYCSTCTTVLSEQKIDKLGCNWVQGEVTPSTCSAKGSIAYSCTRCTNTMSAELPTNANAHQYETKVTPATCYSEGSAETKCKLCTNELSVVTLAKLEHTWNDGKATTSATCIAPGVMTYKCTVDGCNAEKTEPIDALGHNWGNWFVEKASTNTAEGTMKRECTVDGCDAYETHTIPAGGHEWDEGKVTKEATCTSTGTKVYACKNHTGDNACGITFTVTLDKLQHKLTTSTTPATCTTDGKVITKCEKCNTTTITTIIPATGHTYNDGVKTPATCTKTGEILYTCTAKDCGETKKVTLEKLQHVYKQEGAVTAPTCTTSGYTTYSCSNDECTSTIIVLGAPATGHNFDDSIVANVNVTKEATCTTDGSKTVKCKNCLAAELVVAIPAGGHNYVMEGETSPATCEKPATALYKCECGDKYTAVVDENLAEHKWSDWETVKAATSESLGYRSRKCSVCKLVAYEIIEATGEHQFTKKLTAECKAPTCTTDGLDVYGCSFHTDCAATSSVPVSKLGHDAKLEYIAATCENKGSAQVKCSRCPEELSAVTTIPALGHLFDGEGTYVAATCIAEGSMTYTCTRCNSATHSTKIAVDPDAHELATATAAATCKAEGSVITSCTLCNKELVKTTLPKLQHSWNPWVTVKASTNTATGLMSRTCANGCTEEVVIPAGGHTLTEIARTNSTCTVPGSVTYACQVEHTGGVTCGVQVTVELPLAQHTVTTETEAATCTKEGFVKSYCSADGCNKVFADVKLAKLQHVYEEIEEVDATCVKSGYKVYKCNTCTETYNVINGNAKGHNYTVKVSSDASCLEGGKMVLKCADCDATMETSVPALGHDYKLISSTSATCAAAATETYKCSRCEASYTVSTGNKTENHNWTAWNVVVEATYTTLGCESRSCPDCGKVEIKTIEAIGDHAFVDGEIAETKAATCTENGYIIRKCTKHSDCGLTSTEILPATGHNEQTIAAVAATCTTAGSSEGSECTKCGTVLVAPVTLPELGHAWGNEVVTPATCQSEGEIAYTCTRGGCLAAHEVTIPVDGTAHKLETTVNAATCTENGSVTEKCTVDGCSYSKEVVLTAKGHIWNETASSTTPATCENTGSATYKCKYCTAENIVTIPAIGHIYKAGEKVDATCTTSGYTVYTCEHDAKHTYKVYDADATAKPHTWKQTNMEYATCTTNGSVTYKCENCEATKTEIVPAIGHKFNVTEAPATCTQAGTRTYLCTCGGTYTELAEPAKGHSFGEWTVVTEATNGTDGQWKRVCANDNNHVEYITIPAGGHNFDTTTADVYDAPSCTEEGSATYYCKAEGHENCGVTVTVTVPATGHNGEIVYNAPSCETPGSSEIYCNTCNKTIAKEEIPALGYHDFSADGVVNEGDEPTCTEEGTMTFTCCKDGCGAVKKVKIPAKGHSLNTTVTEATCEAEGSVVTKCTVDGCTYVHESKTLAVKPHSISISNAYPGCEKDGYVKEECKKCDYERIISTTPALGHSFAGEETVVTPATCLTKGEKIVKCSYCSKTETVEIPALGHNYEAGEEVEATCTASGYIPYTCQNKDCTSSYKELTSNPKGHTWKTQPEAGEIKATCEIDGKATYKCENCEATNVVVTPKFGHSWTNWTVSKEPTATEDGLKTRTCLRGCTESVTIPALGESAIHKVDFVVNGEIIFSQTVNHLGAATAPAIENKAPDAKYHYSALWDTDFSVVTSDLTVTAVFTSVSHSFGDWVVDTEADCKNAGLRHRVCDCGYVQQEVIERKEHTYIVESEKAPTCTEIGVRTLVCSNCGDRTTENIKKLGHEMTYYEGYKATCDTDGLARHYSCSRCGKKFEDRAGKTELSTVVIVKKYHTYVVVEGVAPTCTAEGVTDYRYCTTCGYTQHPEAIAATGHADVNNDNTCDKCGATYMNGDTIICSCYCHKNGFFNELIYKILSFFWRLFGSNKSCECGKVHY